IGQLEGKGRGKASDIDGDVAEDAARLAAATVRQSRHTADELGASTGRKVEMGTEPARIVQHLRLRAVRRHKRQNDRDGPRQMPNEMTAFHCLSSQGFLLLSGFHRQLYGPRVTAS